ncbi:MAG: SusD/RagB family nutrient-binding outer membrane lipoprotein [Ferruginibacter sp.]|nr:SusD/RagB family nutrient-binding outer membrane lipoprotein [Cytophagales bacterium]
MKFHPFRFFLGALVLLAALFTGGCEDFEELEQNPNRPTSVPASLVFNGILNSMYENPWGDTQKYNQFWASNYNYYGNQEYTWTTTGLNYFTLKNVVKMEEEAKRYGAKDLNPYAALGKFFRAYFFASMTQRVGDIPLTDALKGVENVAPKYDTQKDVYVQILKWLEESNAELAVLIAARDNSLSGDIYLNNDLSKWQKVVNAFKMRVLVSLSKKEGDAELNIRQKFAATVADPATYPLMTGLEDNLAYRFNASVNKYPLNPDEFGKTALRNNMTAALLTPLRELRDPRAFAFAEPAPARLAAGLSPTDYGAFVGARSDEGLDDMSTKVQAGQYSLINRNRYYGSYTGEPTIQIGYPELCFNLAEGFNRGWAMGSAEEYYRKGTQASQNFYGIKDGPNDVFFLKKDGKIGEYDKYTVNFSFDAYYAQPTVKYAGNNASGLRQVLTQKYIAFFQNSGWEAFYNQRRTGIPTFDVGGPGTGGGRNALPLRWQYPENERSTNPANYNEAVQRQFGGKDDVDARMWLLQ